MSLLDDLFGFRKAKKQAYLVLQNTRIYRVVTWKRVSAEMVWLLLYPISSANFLDSMEVEYWNEAGPSAALVVEMIK